MEFWYLELFGTILWACQFQVHRLPPPSPEDVLQKMAQEEEGSIYFLPKTMHLMSWNARENLIGPILASWGGGHSIFWWGGLAQSAKMWD